MSKDLARHRERGMSFLEGGEGDPFLFLHGIPGSCFTWRTVGELLTDHYHVIIPDLAGFGQSELSGEDYYMEAQAWGIKRTLDGLGIREVYLAGHDFGGPVALTLVRLFPELSVKGLVLSATNVFTDTYVPPPLRIARIPLLGTIFFKMMVGNRIGARMLYMAATVQKKEASWEKFKQHLTPSALDLTRRIFQRSLADLKSNYQAVEDLLVHLVAPTLVLWGADDPFFGTSVGERTHRAIHGAELKVYERTGHFVPEERPHLVARDILDFFEGRGSEQPVMEAEG
jgi:pimeloyl-ACP methyl ester carboxylesterase